MRCEKLRGRRVGFDRPFRPRANLAGREAMLLAKKKNRVVETAGGMRVSN